MDNLKKDFTAEINEVIEAELSEFKKYTANEVRRAVFVNRQLEDLGFSLDCPLIQEISRNCYAASEILSRRALITMIEDSVEHIA